MQADFLIIGSGIAALRAAAALSGAGDVLILTKAGPLEGNTGHAQGGIAAAVGAGDTPARHLADTLAAGDGLCDDRAVRVLVENGPRYVRELIDWGVSFDRTANGDLELGLEAAHSLRRVLHVRDATGRDIGRGLWDHVAPMSNVHVHAHACATGLIVEGGRCAGVRFLGEDGSDTHARARCTLIATGGAGQVFSDTTNPPVATGDGIAIAFHAGAAVADLEFVQFHPTALKVAGQPRFLLSEALRGEGARLVNDAGEPFMTRYDPAGDLAPRDRVARGIVREEQRTGGRVYLTLDRVEPAFVRQRFPLIADACRRAGLDLAKDRIPVGPAAHYLMGGVVTDVDGRTTIPGLFAAGEVACTGVHGANRLASNSLLEGLVFGARAGDAMRTAPDAAIDPDTVRRLVSARTFEPAPQDVDQTPWDDVDSQYVFGESRDGRQSSGPASGPAASADVVRRIMWERVGLFRDAAGLRSALNDFGQPREDEASVLTVGRLIARAALRREESRGGHYRLDFPAKDDAHWKLRIREERASVSG